MPLRPGRLSGGTSNDLCWRDLTTARLLYQLSDAAALDPLPGWHHLDRPAVFLQSGGLSIYAGARPSDEGQGHARLDAASLMVVPLVSARDGARRADLLGSGGLGARASCWRNVGYCDG